MKVSVPAGSSDHAAYDVVVGDDALEVLAARAEGARRVLVICQESVVPVASKVAGWLADTGIASHMQVVPDGEDGKTLVAVEVLWGACAQAQLSRGDLIVSVGGGAVSDAAGFVAATWMRGIRVIHAPTTVLGLVDAAVGGKTGINTVDGKNLVGAFHPPAAVVCDPEWFGTLPADQVAAGLAEVVKCGLVADPAILDSCADPEVLAIGSPPFVEACRRAVAVKADVVGRDLREGGLREILNYGHTFAHAVERLEEYRWSHGHAVAVGLVYAARVAQKVVGLPEHVVHRHIEALDALGLPTRYDGASWEALRAVMARDKKNRGGVVRMVLLRDIGDPLSVDGPDEEALAWAAQQVGVGA